ncbi:MAG TPA: amino acid permease [Pyrinomonadaceae bacterium]|nr:amino acid permease [Pyrinomonadaceae bacterium]
MSIDNESATRGLIRGLGLLAAISIIVGNVIGTGVFLKARVMTCNLGEPLWVIAAWVAAGLLTLAGALSYAELTAMKPEAGGEYVYLRDSYGPLSSFLFGWMSIFVSKPGSQASVAVIFAGALNDFLGGAVKHKLFEFHLLGLQVEITTIQLVAVMMIVIFTTINCATVQLSGQIASVLTAVKVGLIVFVGLGALLFATGGNMQNFLMAEQGGSCNGVSDSVRFGAAGYSFASGFAAAMIGALWAYDGWNNLGFVAGEVKEPGKNIPRAIIGSTILVILLYVGVNSIYFYILDPTTIAHVSPDSSVAASIVSRFSSLGWLEITGSAALVIFTVGLMISSLGTLHTSIVAGSRIPFAMAQNGLMLKRLGQLSITGVPITALIFQGFLASILALTGSFDTLTNYVIFGSWIFYGLATSSIFIFRKRHPELDRPYKALGYPLVPVIFLLVTIWLLVRTLIDTPKESFTGALLILLGIPVYYIFIKRNNSFISKAENG